MTKNVFLSNSTHTCYSSFLEQNKKLNILGLINMVKISLKASSWLKGDHEYEEKNQ